MTNFLIYPEINDQNGFPPAVNSAIINSPEAQAELSEWAAAGLAGKASVDINQKLLETHVPTRLSEVSLSATYVPKWKATTAYLAGDKVLSPGGDVVSAIANFTSGASYNAANWNVSSTYTTPAQAAGLSAALSIVFGG